MFVGIGSFFKDKLTHVNEMRMIYVLGKCIKYSLTICGRILISSVILPLIEAQIPKDSYRMKIL